ncbi:WD and tetratricopeptide repeats protein 1-like [Crassostrea virginica]|uniref:WD and tetratricopeptide repeats protein 1-like n=1 Tax=Crassostrea virginica TaxID=6565 RepID=A0A8B8AS21_CRAVI|nr:WD and tetratricopeptide repeats protein 1-like [Crassostrea virginica]
MALQSGILKQKFLRETGGLSTQQFQQDLQVTPDLIQRLGLSKELQGHHGCVNCLEWNERGTLLASGSDDLNVILWDPLRHRTKATINTGHQGNIFSVKFLPNTNDSILVTGAADCKIRVYDTNREENSHVFSCHIGRVKRLAVAPNVPFMFWSAAEDGTIMQFDLRCQEPNQPNPKNVIVNLNAHIGHVAEAKCLAINPLRPEYLAVGANDPYIRMYDRRMLVCRSLKVSQETTNRSPWSWDRASSAAPVSPDDFPIPHDAVTYFIAGHLPQRQQDYKKRYRSLASTYLTFSPDGRELLVNLGGEQIYIFDVNRHRKAEKFDISMVLAANGVVKDTGSSNGFHIHPHRNGATNGVTNGVSSGVSAAAAAMMRAEMDVEEKHRDSLVRKRWRASQPGAKPIPPAVEVIKKKANRYFEMDQCSKAIILYNQAIQRAPWASVLYGNRAAAFMKRKWDGDLYAALRDCHSALQIDPNHLKAHFRLARCLYELSWPQEAYDCLQQFKNKFPDYAKSNACETLDKDIKAAIYSKTDSEDKSESSPEKPESFYPSVKRSTSISDQEACWRALAYDYEARFCGHCNTTTDIKEANYFGSNGQYVVAGSDDGSFFIWERDTTNIVRVLRGDDSIVNCLQPHPTQCLLATSGIDPVVRLWSPRVEDGSKDEREVDNSDDAALANQKRMNADPLEVMLMNMGYRITGVFDVDEEEQNNNDQSVQCRPS